MKPEKQELEIRSFKSPKEFNSWLKKQKDSPGIWLHFYKKDSGVPSINYKEAVDEALCFGWIDGQAKPFDENSWLQRFTPRRVRSIWSKRNRDHVSRLIAEGRMQPSGLAEIERAKLDGRWNAAYDAPLTMEVPEDFLRVLDKNKKAKAFFETLNKTNLYAIAWRLQTAKKPETREKRINIILEMLAKGEKFH